MLVGVSVSERQPFLKSKTKESLGLKFYGSFKGRRVSAVLGI